MTGWSSDGSDEPEQTQGAPGKLTWDGILFLSASFLTLFARFRIDGLLLGWYQDDFFYYEKVARNIAASGASTFDGTHLTNGYHPLWMAVLVVLNMLLQGTVFFVAVQAVSLAAAAFCYLLLLRIFRLMLAETVAHVGAFAVGMEALMLIRYGMEVTLTLPLGLLLLWLLLRDGFPQTFGRTAWLGFISSLLILSRLDAAILVALLAVAALVMPRSGRASLRTAGGFLCGVLPLLALYFTLNLHYFHLLTPVSGLVKQTKSSMLPSAITWIALLPSNRMKLVVLLPQILVLLGGALGLAINRSVRPRGVLGTFDVRRPVLAAVLVFPLVHLTILSIRSDWDLWPWYFYSITLGAVGAYVYLARWLPEQGTIVIGVTYACMLVVYAAVYAVNGPNSISILESSQQVAAYMDAHPGIYLMGDQAGTTAYLSHQPIVQAEGLVMDREFLNRMRESQSLRDVANAYRARYYAVLGPGKMGDCLAVAEPSNAGPASPKMHGTICHPPLAAFTRTSDGAVIRIFDAAWIQ